MSSHLRATCIAGMKKHVSDFLEGSFMQRGSTLERVDHNERAWSVSKERK
jgi:hypothetical protein